MCKDAPGFIVNRVARHYYLEAMKLVETGAAGIETVDEVMEASGFRWGPSVSWISSAWTLTLPYLNRSMRLLIS